MILKLRANNVLRGHRAADICRVLILLVKELRGRRRDLVGGPRLMPAVARLVESVLHKIIKSQQPPPPTPPFTGRIVMDDEPD